MIANMLKAIDMIYKYGLLEKIEPEEKDDVECELLDVLLDVATGNIDEEIILQDDDDDYYFDDDEY